MASPIRAETLIEKLQDLPADKLVEVEDFVDFLRDRQRRSVEAVPGQARPSVKDVPPGQLP